jgi:hypothetical protein
MSDIIRAINELLRTIQQIAGGKIRGQVAFWVVIIIIIAISSKTAYDNVDYVLIKIGVVQGLPYMFLSLIVALIATAMLLGFAGGIGMLFGMLVRVAFVTPTTYRIDGTLTKLLSILKELDRTANTDDVKRLLKDTEEISNRWNNSRINKFVKWSNRSRLKKMDVKK